MGNNSSKIRNFVEVLEGVSNLDFSSRVTLEQNDDFYNAIAIALNTVLDSLEDTVVQKSELEASKAETENQKEILFQTLEQAVDAIITIDEDRKVSFCNAMAERMLGYKREELINRSPEQLLSKVTDHSKFENIKSSTANFTLESGGELRMVKSNGEKFWGLISVSEIKTDSGVRHTIFIKDITDKKEEEEQLRQINDLLRQKAAFSDQELTKIRTFLDIIFENLPLAIINFDREGKILYFQANRLKPILSDGTGVVFDLFPENIRSEIIREIYHAIKGQEVRFRIPISGHFYEFFIKPVFNGDELMHISSVVFDVNDIVVAKKRIEEALDKEVKFNRSRSKFIEESSHQFRTPLSIIKSNFDLLEKFLDKVDDETKQKFKKISSRVAGSIGEITDMLERLQMVIDLESLYSSDGAFENIDLEKLVQTLIKSVISKEIRKEKPVFSLKGKKYKQNIAIDKRRFCYIFEELLRNAIKFSDGADKPVKINLSYSEDTVELVIKDEGIGMSKEDMHHIYEPFFRGNNAVSFKGLGVGLNMVKRCLINSNMEVAFESKLNSGTKAYIKLNPA